MLKAWDRLPPFLQTDAVLPYYNYLRKKRFSLFWKRIFDVCVAAILLVLLLPVFLIVSIAVRIDSKGPVLFLQARVSQYGRIFRIFKFRTMVLNAEKGATVTVQNDPRVTRVGRFLRRTRLDETPQVLNVLVGHLTFVGTRPPLPVSIAAYEAEWNATLLLPAGITSAASIAYKDEEMLLADARDPEVLYLQKILPAKMKINLEALLHFSLIREFHVLWKTLGAVLRIK